ncbi:hypothetical protein OC844_004826 [Tilletia horrida]|nr:hypothetical protein OC844_004826 [Tilletia horrida]
MKEHAPIIDRGLRRQAIDMDAHAFRHIFRFDEDEGDAILQVIALPDRVQTAHGDVAEAEVAFLLLLAYLGEFTLRN